MEKKSRKIDLDRKRTDEIPNGRVIPLRSVNEDDPNQVNELLKIVVLKYLAIAIMHKKIWPDQWRYYVVKI